MNIITTDHGWWIDHLGISHTEWTAIDDDTFSGPGSVVGSGSTKQEAIDDLLGQIEDKSV